MDGEFSLTGHPKTKAYRLFAWIGEDHDGCQGIVTFKDPQFGTIPLVASDETVARTMKPLADAYSGGLPVNLVVYEWSKILDQINS